MARECASVHETNGDFAKRVLPDDFCNHGHCDFVKCDRVVLAAPKCPEKELQLQPILAHLNHIFLDIDDGDFTRCLSVHGDVYYEWVRRMSCPAHVCLR